MFVTVFSSPCTMSYSSIVLPKPYHAHQPPGDLIQMQSLSQSVCVNWGQRFCIVNKPSGDQARVCSWARISTGWAKFPAGGYVLGLITVYRYKRMYKHFQVQKSTNVLSIWRQWKWHLKMELAGMPPCHHKAPSAAMMNHLHLSLFLSSKTAIIHNLKLMSVYCSPDSV